MSRHQSKDESKKSRCTVLNKKGDVINIIPIIVTVFGLAIALPIIFSMTHSINTGFQNNEVFNASGNATAIMNSTESGVANFDFAVAIVWIGLLITSGIFAFLVRTNPIFFPINVFLLFIVLMIAIPIQMTWEQLRAVEPYSTAILTLPITDFIMGNCAYWTLLYGIVIMVLMFSINSGEGR